MSQDPPTAGETGSAPTTDEIRERAYDLWDRHHRPVGYDLEFWFMAQRELMAKQQTIQAGNKVEVA